MRVDGGGVFQFPDESGFFVARNRNAVLLLVIGDFDFRHRRTIYNFVVYGVLEERRKDLMYLLRRPEALRFGKHVYKLLQFERLNRPDIAIAEFRKYVRIRSLHV